MSPGSTVLLRGHVDNARISEIRAQGGDPLVQSIRGAIDQVATTEELERIAPLLPADWLAPAATGSPEQCAAAVLRQLDLGADGVILHGATPTELTPVVEAYRAIRPAGRFDDLARNPGGPRRAPA